MGEVAETRRLPGEGEPDWCLFLDRDGVINRRISGDYVRNWADFEFLPGSVEAVATLSGWAPHVVVVTNQQGIGKGLMPISAVDEIHQRMTALIRDAGGRIDDVLVCPHLANERCPCRKPGIGLAEEWLTAHPGIARRRCVVVGDSASDMAMGRSLTQGAGVCVWIGPTPTRLEEVDYDMAFADLVSFSTRVGRALSMGAGQ